MPGKWFDHMVPGSLYMWLGLMILRAPVGERHNLLQRRAVFGCAIMVLPLIAVIFARLDLLHKVQHVMMLGGYVVAMASSILERGGYLGQGSSNLCLAGAFGSNGLLLLGHPSPHVVETRGHQLAALCNILCVVAPLSATDKRAHVATSCFALWNGWLWIALGFWWHPRFTVWGQGPRASRAKEDSSVNMRIQHEDMMMLHIAASMGIFLTCGVVVCHLKSDQHPAATSSSLEYDKVPTSDALTIGAPTERLSA